MRLQDAKRLPFDRGPQIELFALDGLGMLFADYALLGGDMPLALLACRRFAMSYNIRTFAVGTV